MYADDLASASRVRQDIGQTLDGTLPLTVWSTARTASLEGDLRAPGGRVVGHYAIKSDVQLHHEQFDVMAV